LKTRALVHQPGQQSSRWQAGNEEEGLRLHAPSQY
jgi:hypothetical protein